MANKRARFIQVATMTEDIKFNEKIEKKIAKHKSKMDMAKRIKSIRNRFHTVNKKRIGDNKRSIYASISSTLLHSVFADDDGGCGSSDDDIALFETENLEIMNL